MKEIIATTFRVSVIALSLLAFGLSVSNAQDGAPNAKKAAEEQTFERGHKRHGGGHGIKFAHRILRQLDLTEAQDAEIKSIFAEQKTKVAPHIAELKKNREALRELSKDGVFDEDQVRNIATQQATTMTELIVAKEQGKAKIFAVLTEEQRAEAQKLLDSRGPRRGKCAH